MLWEAVQVDARKAGSPLLAPSGASASKETHTFGWRDAMDIIVKWRQLSEPNDQVARPQASLRCLHPALPCCEYIAGQQHDETFMSSCGDSHV